MAELLVGILANGILQPILVEQAKPEPMKHIKSFDPGMLPPSDLSKFTDEVNALIAGYNKIGNSEDTKNNRIAILEQIQAKIKAINYKYKPDSIANSKEYLEISASLFNDIQKQYVSMGKTMHKGDNANSPLAGLIANMHPTLVDALSEILVRKISFKLNDDIESLCDKYADDKEILPSVLALRAFIKNHEINYLGGTNSRSFLVTENRTQAKSVLKVEFRLDMPKDIEAYLRSKMADDFTVIDAERQVAVTFGGELTGRALLVTEYCNNGNLQAYSKNLDNLSQNEKMKKMGFIFQQMASTMLKIQEAGCLFADAKICNWLVDDKNRLCITDTKSFVFVDAKGVYSASLPLNEHYSFISTKKFNPPEYNEKIRIAESTHAFLLGLNLYVFATGAQPPNKDNGKTFNYHQEIFQSPEGQYLKELISALVKNNPRERLSLKDAHHRLFLLAAPELRNVFSELKKLKVCENDVMMEEFIREKQQQISNAPNLGERQRILQELTTIITALKANESFTNVKNTVNQLRVEATKFYNYGKGAKAEKIERALVELPISERMKLEKSTHVSTQKVMEALAAKRVVGGVREAILTSAKEIDLKNAAGTFKSFKARFKQEAAAPPEKKDTAVDALNRLTPGI